MTNFNADHRRELRAWTFVLMAAIGVTVDAMAQQVVTTQVGGAYLDLENISPNNILGTQQQVGGLFVQGGFDCASSFSAGACTGTGPVGGYQTMVFNEPTITSIGGYAPFEQTVLIPPSYSPALPNNGNSYAFPGYPIPNAVPLVYANGGNQIGFTLATSSSTYGVAGSFSNGAPFPDLVGTASTTPPWNFNAYDGASGAYAAQNLTQFLTINVNCLDVIQVLNLLNCQGLLAPVVPFPQNVVFTLSSQANNLITPTFYWTQPAGYTPDVLRMEIWQLNSGAPATNIFSASLANTQTSYTIPATFTNLTTGLPASLVVNQNYAIDIENITLRNSAPPLDTSNENIWSRSRSFFDFTPEASANNIPAGTPIQIPVVSTTAGGSTTYVFQQSVTAGTTAYIDPAIATGYLYQTGASDPNFTSVTPVTSVGSGTYQLLLLGSGGTYVFAANISVGQTYTFAGSGVRSFEIVGIPVSAGLDPSNTSAFITG